jgi:REP element-mobilizing transposase RayT
MPELPKRKRLHHVPPPWVKAGSIYFLTINAAQRGSTALLGGETPKLLLNSARYYHDRAAWWLELFLLMPDHLHVLLAVPSDQQLDRTITAWKSFQVKTARVAWQSAFSITVCAAMNHSRRRLITSG